MSYRICLGTSVLVQHTYTINSRSLKIRTSPCLDYKIAMQIAFYSLDLGEPFSINSLSFTQHTSYLAEI